MKNLIYKTALISIAIIFFNNINVFADDDTFNKKVQYNFDANEQTALEINNKFGDINFIDSKSNKINIEVVIEIESDSQEKADKILNQVDIKAEELENLIKVETIIDEDLLKSNSKRKHLKINYTIALPIYIKLYVLNKYGDVYINEHHGKSNIDVKFGDINANKLMFDDSKPLSSISVSYGDANITECTWGKFSTSYGDLVIGNSKAIICFSSYSDVNIKNASSLICESKFDDYELGNINNLVMNAKYVDIDVKRISNKLDLDMQFGDFEVESINPDFSEIKIKNEYGEIDLNLSSNTSCSIDAELEYCEIEVAGDIKVEKKDNFVKKISGRLGNKSNSESRIIINSKFGSIDVN